MHRVKEPELIQGFCPIDNYKKTDMLDIEKDAKNFIKTIIFNENSINSGSVGLLSKFGSGKSFFMQYLYCVLYHIKNEKKDEKNENINIESKILDSNFIHPIYPVYIDISKYENSQDNLLVLIFAEINNIFNNIEKDEIKNKNDEKIKETITKKREIFKKIIPLAINVTTGMFAKKFNKYEELINFAGEVSEKLSTIMLETINLENKYLDKLTELTKENNTPLIILIDNLDRCKPEFVLDFFVLMKRLFNVENVLFVIAYDKQQIINLLRTKYSYDIDISSYLKKYIPMEFYLSQNKDIIDFTNKILNDKENKIERENKEENNKNEDKIIVNNNIIIDINNTTYRKLAIILWCEIYRKTKISLRQFEQGLELIKLIFNSLQKINLNDPSTTYELRKTIYKLVFIYMKSVYPYQYQNLYDYLQWQDDDYISIDEDTFSYIFNEKYYKGKTFIKDMDRVLTNITKWIDKLIMSMGKTKVTSKVFEDINLHKEYKNLITQQLDIKEFQDIEDKKPQEITLITLLKEIEMQKKY